jgi:hypothetical protein
VDSSTFHLETQLISYLISSSRGYLISLSRGYLMGRRVNMIPAPLLFHLLVEAKGDTNNAKTIRVWQAITKQRGPSLMSIGDFPLAQTIKGIRLMIATTARTT